MLLAALAICLIVYWGGRFIRLQSEVKKQKQIIQTFEVKEQKQKEELERLLQDQAKLKKENATLKQTKVIKATRVASVKTYSGSCYTAMKQVFPQSQWANASAIIKAESGGNPNAVSRTNDHGCFQLHDGYQSWGKAVYNPLLNAQKAYRMYCSRGWSPWTTARKLGLR